MKNKLGKIILLTLAVITLIGSVNVSAYSPYETYTYSIDGIPLESPHAYTPAVETYGSKDMGLSVDLKGVTDVVADAEGNLYLADSGNNRIVILNRYYEYQKSITTFINEQGNNDALLNPWGVFIFFGRHDFKV